MMVDRVACFLQGSLGSWCFYSGVLKYFTNAEYYPVAGIALLSEGHSLRFQGNREIKYHSTSFILIHISNVI